MSFFSHSPQTINSMNSLSFYMFRTTNSLESSPLDPEPFPGSVFIVVLSLFIKLGPFLADKYSRIE